MATNATVSTIGIRWATGLMILFGLVAIVTPFATGVAGTPRYVDIVAGLAVIVLAGIGEWTVFADRSRDSLWPAIGNALVGIGLAAYPFYTRIDAYFEWTTLIVGVLVFLAAAYNVFASMNEPKAERGSGRPSM
jgi:uncharacterized membrane protein HdeD (DUF308 family)